ncbi:MAG: metal ABC transporter ATP-binding protein [Acidaminococcaceae bacterium]|nr:metal ABC transporter ATP-binding protein [Acidaminococcaceae bacterium]
MKIISLKNLSFDYGDGWVFHKLNIDIEEGDFVAVIGANGAGKSTLLKMLAHLVKPTEGTIEYYGTDITQFKDWGKIGYVPQGFGKSMQDFPISVEEVIATGLLKPQKTFQRHNEEDRKEIEKVVKFFHLQDFGKRRMGELSGGQQQKVFLARAMVKQPRILLLDEPATAIDTHAKEELYAYLQQINQEAGVTIVMVSHDLELAAASAKSALCLDHGVCFWGEVQAALNHHHHHGYFYR